ncbi:MAG: phosphocholine cytidylyltransferase family protein [candidate division WOR-3 bacterium]
MKNFQAVILAAGTGERLKPDTETKPKTMLRVGRTTFIGLIIENIYKNELKDILIVGGHQFSVLKRYVLSLKKKFKDINFTFVENKKYKEYNNCYTLFTALPHIKKDFIIFNSDIIFDSDILKKVLMHDENCIVVDNVKTLGEEEMKVLLKDGYVSSLSKKNRIEDSVGEYIGITMVKFDSIKAMMKHYDTFDFLAKGKYYEDLIVDISKDGVFFRPVYTDGLLWTEVDTFEDLSYAREVIYKNLKKRNKK